jgi:hypothetical protein
MRPAALLYLVLSIASAFTAAFTLIPLYRDGSQAVPGWTGLVEPGRLSDSHSFLSGKCETCHTPTKGIEATACAGCHAPAAAGLARQATAFHASIQDCRGCHVEHAGAGRIVRMDHAALLRGAPDHHRLDLSSRIAHDVAGYLGARRTDTSAVRALNCAGCHANQDRHRQFFGKDCATCHATDTWRIASFLHPSPASKDCVQCHQAPASHYMGHFHMISKPVAGKHDAKVEQCYLCHVPSSFNEIKGVGWYKHH